MATFDCRRRNGDVVQVRVDDADLNRVLARGGWFIDAHGYAMRNVPRRENGGKRTTEALHRFLLDLVPGDGLELGRFGSEEEAAEAAAAGRARVLTHSEL